MKDKDHMETSIREVISKNSGEDAIKAFSKFRFSETIGISKQVVEMAELVDEIFPEESHIIAYKIKSNGEKTPPNEPNRKMHSVYTRYLKTTQNTPIRGIRELLQPALEDIAVFDINNFSKELQKFEEDWTMFEEKPKPAAPADDAQANLATKKGGKNCRKN